MALVIRRNPAPLKGALLVTNPKRRKKKKAKRQTKKSRSLAAKRGWRKRKRNALSVKKRRNALAVKRRNSTKKGGVRKTARRAYMKKRNATKKGGVRTTARRAYKKRNAVKKGGVRKTARRAYIKKRNATKKGGVRTTARRAYIKKRNPVKTRIVKHNPLQVPHFKPIENLVKKFPLVGGIISKGVQPALLGMVGGTGVYYVGKFVGPMFGKIPVVGQYVGKFGYTFTGLAMGGLVQFIPSSYVDKKLKDALSIAFAAAGGVLNAYKLIKGDADDYGEFDDDFAGLALSDDDMDGLALSDDDDMDGFGAMEDELGDGMLWEVEPLSGLGQFEPTAVFGQQVSTGYEGSELGDAHYSGDDLSVEEGQAALSGAYGYAHAFGQAPHNRVKRHKIHSHLAGRHGHRWGWLIHMIGWKRFAALASMTPEKRLEMISQLRQAAVHAAQAKFDEQNTMAATAGLAMDMSGLAIDNLSGLAMTGAVL